LHKLKHQPYGALATSSHDTKYSEDARLRMHVLSEMPKKWGILVHAWKKQNHHYKTCINGKYFPDLNTEYYIYQQLIGQWPAPKERLWECFNKAIREAGVYTSWEHIHPEYELAVKNFFEAIVEPRTENLFLQSFLQFQSDVTKYGILNSLSALTLKMGSCGVVDVYQGDEWINYSMVDPDNRRAVDFDARAQSLKEQEVDKIVLMNKALLARKKHKKLFLQGDYIPLQSPDNVIGFIRKYKDQSVVVLGARFFSEDPITGTIELPHEVNKEVVTDLFTGEKILLHKGMLDLKRVFSRYPCALLE